MCLYINMYVDKIMLKVETRFHLFGDRQPLDK